ncbi:unnamed protein product [Cylindrotheca closterium]|uniref:NnrU domain-containing protein n=1 Tax=Cylindrotheca closterium TaxID=2856 RepID=A0AAD2FPB3_9STRA|nr:unnamed protein product [Cylindrotheca closterium]
MKPSIRWATLGWTFFIAENAILSENRSMIIEQLGDENYHLVYGTLSTAATASIGYGYYQLRKAAQSSNVTNLLKSKPPVGNMAGAWIFMSVGIFLASQGLPRMQIPVSSSGGSSLQVRCPFDFTGKKDNDSSPVSGIDRITRHPGLWSMGLVGIGNSLLATSVPMRLWWSGPAFVAWLGGAHTDSRFRRGLGGQMDPMYDSLTSNVPFFALVSGKQGSGSWKALQHETKELNALASVAASTIWILRRIR